MQVEELQDAFAQVTRGIAAMAAGDVTFSGGPWAVNTLHDKLKLKVKALISS